MPKKPKKSKPLDQMPWTVQRAMTVIWANVGFQVLGVMLRLAVPDQLALQISDGRSVQNDPGLSGVIVGLVMIGIFIYFAMAFRRGAKWAWIVLLTLTTLFMMFSLFGVVASFALSGVPVLAILMNVVQFVLLVALLNYLLRSPTAAWCQ